MMNLLKTNTKFAKNVCNVLSRSYCKPLSLINPLLVPGHMNAVVLEEDDVIPHSKAEASLKASNDFPKPKVIIIGAGIAGLSAANYLEANGVTNYVILEAKNRVGGRIHTASMCNREVDLGADWIVGSGIKNSVTQLALEENIFDCPEKEKLPCEVPYYTTDGRVVDPAVGLLGCVAFREIEKCARKVFASNDPNNYGDLQTFFSIRIQQQLHAFPREYQYDAEKVMYGQANHMRYFLGGSLSDVDTRLYGSRNFLSGVKQRIPNGFKRVLNPLLRDIPSDKICFKKAVRRIVSHPDGGCCARVTVCCCHGEEFSADYVICTVPLAVLKLDADLIFDPPLPKEKLAAFENVKNGYCNKVLLEYAKPFWASGYGKIRLAWSPEELDNRNDWTKGISLFEEVPGTNNILCCYVSGKECQTMEQCNLQDVAESVTYTLKKFLGDPAVPYPTRIMRSSWALDQFARASTYYLGRDSHLDLFEVICSPYAPNGKAPTVLFAGDGFHADYLGTAHGARSSGVNAANKLMTIQKKWFGKQSSSEATCCL